MMSGRIKRLIKNIRPNCPQTPKADRVDMGVLSLEAMARAAPNTLSPRSMDDLRSIDADTEYPSETNVCPGDCDPVCQEVEEPTHSLQWARVSNRALSGVPGNVSDIKFASIERERMRILESDGEWAHAEMPNRLTSVLSSRCPIIKSALGMAAC